MEERVMRKNDLKGVCEKYLDMELDDSIILVDVLPEINNTKSDLVVLDSWKAYFQEIQTPYIITKRERHYSKGAIIEKRTFTLWKQRRA